MIVTYKYTPFEFLLTPQDLKLKLKRPVKRVLNLMLSGLFQVMDWILTGFHLFVLLI